MQILCMSVNKTEQNFDDKFPTVGTKHLKMPDKCQEGWAHLELIELFTWELRKKEKKGKIKLPKLIVHRKCLVFAYREERKVQGR